MTRIRRPPQQRRTAVASYLVRRVDEEKRRHPEKTYAQIGRELGITQKDPARLIRKLRSGETSGRVIVPELAGIRPPRRRRGVDFVRPPTLRGQFVISYQWWYVARPEMKYWARANLLVQHASPLDIFRLRDDPRVIAAVERDLAQKAQRKMRERDGSLPIASRGEYDFQIDQVAPEHTHRATPLVILGRANAAISDAYA